MVEILYGKPVAEKINAQTRSYATGKKIAVLLPNEPSSQSYKKTIVTTAEKLGIEVVNDEASADGVIGDVTDPSKDIDCQTEENLGKLFMGKPLFKPATAEAVIELLKHYGIEIAGKHAVIVGRSTIVGKPLAHLLLGEDATVTVCHSKTKDLASFTKQADILVVAAGRANLITKDYVNDKAVVVDVGTNIDEKGKLCGDVDFDSVKDHVSAISPVPGGVGPVTTALLLKHTCAQSLD